MYILRLSWAHLLSLFRLYNILIARFSLFFLGFLYVRHSTYYLFKMARSRKRRRPCEDDDERPRWCQRDIYLFIYSRRPSSILSFFLRFCRLFVCITRCSPAGNCRNTWKALARFQLRPATTVWWFLLSVIVACMQFGPDHFLLRVLICLFGFENSRPLYQQQ